jgi:hypothetical protein
MQNHCAVTGYTSAPCNQAAWHNRVNINNPAVYEEQLQGFYIEAEIAILSGDFTADIPSSEKPANDQNTEGQAAGDK